MPDRRTQHSYLPEAVEERVLAILDGDEARRDDALRELLLAEPQHARTIRAWLASAGVTVPGTEPGKDTVPGAESLPLRLDAYVLQQLLGRGGFGTVYRAEQQEPIRRPVAVKVLNPGMDSREVLARFAAEREAMNRLDHPGIARLLDAGTTPKGRPYFVMELVEGPTLLQHCQRQRLPLRARLQLFLQVMDAMQHAHQKAVLHRDLSSNNVLVADPLGRPQPKIIDFGIAKSLNDRSLQAQAMTFQGTLMGTPEFMSPEQASGRIDAIDTRTDVYALGVQLYELLTEQLPIPGVVLRAQGLQGLATAIQRHQVARPSQVAPRERRKLLEGDLDAILGRALAKSKDERYATVAEFAADLRAHLADQPVRVATPTRWYRLRKFVRRNRAQSVAAAVAALGLLAGIAGLLVALQVANQALATAQQQREAIATKADAGFRLLANEERLRAAIEAATQLPPPWPQHRPALLAWLQQHGEPLAQERRKLRDNLERVEARLRSTSAVLRDPADLHLLTALRRLQRDLDEFLGDTGTLAAVRERLRQLDLRVAPAMQRSQQQWQQCLAAIRQSDGTTATTQYHGLLLPELPGLLPLGKQPDTGLHEFLDLLSHPDDAPIPERDPATGRLPTDRDHGIVFVLLPPGMPRLGAFRGQPGLPQNDPEAADDELGGGLVNLDELLLARTELTAGQWARLSGQPLRGDALLPATGIDWQQARAVLGQYDLDLPTEAQWEYAARAGSPAPWHTGRDAFRVTDAAWFGPQPQAVGLLQPNRFGLHDMHGNVAEWCRCEYLPYRESIAKAGDGRRERDGASGLLQRVVRGGHCQQSALASRSSARRALAEDQRSELVGLRPLRLLRR